MEWTLIKMSFTSSPVLVILEHFQVECHGVGWAADFSRSTSGQVDLLFVAPVLPNVVELLPKLLNMAAIKKGLAIISEYLGASKYTE